VALARVPGGFQSVSAAKRGEQAPVPSIKESELRFNGLLNLFCGGEGLPHLVDCCGCGIPFPGRGGAFEQSWYLAQLLAEFRFGASVVIERVRTSPPESKPEPRFPRFHREWSFWVSVEHFTKMASAHLKRNTVISAASKESMNLKLCESTHRPAGFRPPGSVEHHNSS
jgi:hypothetical protein